MCRIVKSQLTRYLIDAHHGIPQQVFSLPDYFLTDVIPGSDVEFAFDDIAEVVCLQVELLGTPGHRGLSVLGRRRT